MLLTGWLAGWKTRDHPHQNQEIPILNSNPIFCLSFPGKNRKGTPQKSHPRFPPLDKNGLISRPSLFSPRTKTRASKKEVTESFYSEIVGDVLMPQLTFPTFWLPLQVLHPPCKKEEVEAADEKVKLLSSSGKKSSGGTVNQWKSSGRVVGG